MAFAQPSAPNSGDNFVTAEHKGHLLIVYPKTFLENQTTTKGLSDLADCDIIVVDKYDATGKPLAFHGARLFGNLARSVRNDIGGQVLGRLNQITSANGNTPWILENFTDQDQAAADPIDTAYRQGHFAPTQNPMQPPPPAAYAPATPTPAASPPAWTPQGAQPPAAPAQQWQAPPVQAAPAPAPAAAPAPQWSPGPATAPAPTQQWSAPPQAAPPVAPTAPAAAIDPGLLKYLADRGITGPFPDQATAEAVAASLPQ